MLCFLLTHLSSKQETFLPFMADFPSVLSLNHLLLTILCYCDLDALSYFLKNGNISLHVGLGSDTDFVLPYV